MAAPIGLNIQDFIGPRTIRQKKFYTGTLVLNVACAALTYVPSYKYKAILASRAIALVTSSVTGITRIRHGSLVDRAASVSKVAAVALGLVAVAYYRSAFMVASIVTDIATQTFEAVAAHRRGDNKMCGMHVTVLFIDTLTLGATLAASPAVMAILTVSAVFTSYVSMWTLGEFEHSKGNRVDALCYLALGMIGLMGSGYEVDGILEKTKIVNSPSHDTIVTQVLPGNPRLGSGMAFEHIRSNPPPPFQGFLNLNIRRRIDDDPQLQQLIDRYQREQNERLNRRFADHPLLRGVGERHIRALRDVAARNGRANNNLNTRDVHDIDAEVVRAIAILREAQGDMTRAEIARNVTEFKAYLHARPESAEKSRAIRALEGPRDTDDWGPFLCGNGSANAELIARLWSYSTSYEPQEPAADIPRQRELAKEDIVKALSKCFNGDGTRVCNPGKRNRLVASVLQGRLPGVNLNEFLVDGPIADLVDEFLGQHTDDENHPNKENRKRHGEDLTTHARMFIAEKPAEHHEAFMSQISLMRAALDDNAENLVNEFFRIDENRDLEGDALTAAAQTFIATRPIEYHAVFLAKIQIVRELQG